MVLPGLLLKVEGQSVPVILQALIFQHPAPMKRVHRVSILTIGPSPSIVKCSENDKVCVIFFNE